MPVTYEIDKTRNIIRTRCTGDVKFEEVVGHFKDLVRDPVCPPHLHVLLDLTELTSVPTSEQLTRVSDEIRTASAKVRFDACAIAVSSELIFGMMRMFEAFAEENFGATRTFRGLEEAERWLQKQVGGA